MTSVIAIKTNSGIEGVVLGSDTQITHFKGDGKFLAKKEISKIIYGERWMMSYAGETSSKGFYKFIRILEGDKRYLSKEKKEDTPGKIIRRAVDNYFREGNDIQGSHFKEIYEMNASSLREEGINLDDLPSFVLSTYFDRRAKGLWYVDEFGNLMDSKNHILDENTEKDFDYVCLGTGGENIEKFVEKKVIDGEIEPNDITLKAAFKIVRDSLHEANSKDNDTGPMYDISILTKTGVVSYAGRYKEAISNSVERLNKEIEDEISKLTNN